MYRNFLDGKKLFFGLVLCNLGSNPKEHWGHSKKSIPIMSSFEDVTTPCVLRTASESTFRCLQNQCFGLRMPDKRNHHRMPSKFADGKPTWYQRSLGGRSILSVSNGTCEEAKSVDVLAPSKSLVKHHVESIQRFLHMQTCTYNDLLVEDESGIVTCRDRVPFW